MKNFCSLQNTFWLLFVGFSFSPLAFAQKKQDWSRDLQAANSNRERGAVAAQIFKDSARTPTIEQLRNRIRAFKDNGYLGLALVDSQILFENFNPRRADLIRLSEIVLELGAYDFLTGQFEKYEKFFENNLPDEWKIVRSAYYLRNSNPTAAQKWLPGIRPPKGLENSKALAQFFIVQGYARYFTGDIQGALTVLRNLALEFTDLNPYQASLARQLRAQIFFTQGQLQTALNETSAIPRNTPQWFESVRLGAWSAYRLGDFNLTLGQLMTLHSPYLVGKFSPESLVLEAATLYQLCHYSSAKKSIEKLRNRYQGFLRDLDLFSSNQGSRLNAVVWPWTYATTNRKAPAGYKQQNWDRLMDGILQSESVTESGLLANQIDFDESLVVQHFKPQNRFERTLYQRYVTTLRSMFKESLRLGRKAIEARLPILRDEVSQSLESALAVEVEINSRLRERLALKTQAQERDVDFEASLNKGFEFWPFQGEFWRDETGHYFFATTDVCEKSLAGAR